MPNYWPIGAGSVGPAGPTGPTGPQGAQGVPGSVTNSGTLTSDQPVFGNGTVVVKIGTKHGSTLDVATVSGAFIPGHVVTSDASGNLVDGGAAPSSAPYFMAASAAFSGGGSALTSGTSAGVSLVYCAPVIRACNAISWTITVDAGTAGFRVWKKAAGTAVPTVADTITTADLAISTGTNLKSTSFANFTGAVAPTFAVGDIIAVQLNAAATATYAAFSLVCQ